MDFEIQSKADALVVAVRGRVDTASASRFAQQTQEALERPEKKWVFDLSGLEYVSSAGLRVFLTTAKALKAAGGELRLAAAVPGVHKVFKIAGLFSLFNHFDTPDAALDTF